MAATGDSLFHVNSSRVFPRDSTSESVGKSKTKQLPVSNPSRRFAMSTKHFPTTAPTGTTRGSPFSGDRRLEKREIAEAVTATRSDDTAVEPGNLKEYFERSKELVGLSDSGPPRWFTPLECDGSLTNSPLLLFLPGITGVGLELIKQHKRLGKIFEVWCLHIPVTDQTPFTELVKLVERTIKSEHHRSPNRPIYIVGESFGGCLALAVAASNPDIDIVLILVNPATSFSRSQLLQLIPLLDVIPDQLPLSLPDILSLMTGDPLRTVINSVMNGLPFQQTIGKLSQDLAAISSYLSVLANILPKEKLRWKLHMLGSASELSNLCLHAVKAETLIISSGKDQLLPSQEEAERLYKVLPHCEIRKFNDGGHFLFLEDGFDLVTIMKRAGYYRRGKYIDYVSDFMLPTPTEYQQLYDEDGAKWFDIITSPVMLSTLEDGKIVRGLAGIPSEGPVLLVGYHMLLGLEVAPLITKIYSERDILLRGIAHPLIFRNKDGFPYSAAFDLARLMGAVPVSPFNFYKLMSSKSHVLLYPGGEREALHRKGEEYKLFWPEQSEFVRMAARFNATIIPFGAIGEDDIGEVVGDLDVLMKIPYFRGEIDKWRNKAIELRTGMKREVANQDMHIPGILPKFPGRFYYYFGKPIETKGMKQDLGDREKFHELYLQVKSKVARCLAYLREKRENDPYRNIVSRSIYQCTHGFTHEVPTFEL